MAKMRLFIKSIHYSIRLTFKASGLMLLIYFILNILGSSIKLFSAFVLKSIFDSIVVENLQIGDILFWVGIYAASLVIMQTNNALQRIIYDSVFKKAEHLYECRLAEKLAKIPLSVIDSSEGKDLVDDVRYAKNSAVYTTYNIIEMFSLLYTFAVAFFTLVRFNIWFSMLFLILTLPGVVFSEVFHRRSEKLRREKAPDVRKSSYYRWILTDSWPAKDVRMYDLTDPIKGRYNEEKSRYLYANKKLDQKRVISLLFAETIQRSGEMAFIVFVVFQAVYGHISIGDITLYIGFALTISNAFSGIVFNLVTGYTRTTEIMDRLFEFLDIEERKHGAVRVLKDFSSLEFEDVYFKYPYTDKYVLAGVSFKLYKGDKLSIVGVNGAGKSTIIKLMLGLYDIESGQILINGHPISEYDIQAVRNLFSVLFQSFVQYPLTLRDNVALSQIKRRNNDDEIVTALKQSGVYEELKPKLAIGLDSFMTRQFDDNGTELSTGQWQKIALSRAYFKAADIVIFDEPSAALDAEAEDKIFKNFESISDNKTGIMISHRISSSRMSNRIIVLDEGKIIEQGTHDELISHDGLYSKLYNLQREKYTVREVQ